MPRAGDDRRTVARDRDRVAEVVAGGPAAGGQLRVWVPVAHRLRLAEDVDGARIARIAGAAGRSRDDVDPSRTRPRPSRGLRRDVAEAVSSACCSNGSIRNG